MNTARSVSIALALLLLLQTAQRAASVFAPTQTDWDSLNCDQLTDENTDELEGCRFSIVKPDHEEVSCKLVIKERNTNGFVTEYRKVLLLTNNFRLTGNISHQDENTYCASLTSINLDIRNGSISETHTVGDLPPAAVTFLYFLTDDSHIIFRFTKKITVAKISVNPECRNDTRKKMNGTHCVEKVRFLKEIKRGAFHLEFGSDEFWRFMKRRFIEELGAEMTDLKLTSAGQLSAISLQFFTRLISSELHMKELTLGRMNVGHLEGPLVTMPTLQVLRLPDDGIKTISEETLLAVPNLLKMDLAGNELEKLPNWLPAALVALNVSQNRLVALPSQLPQTLTYLNISYNTIRELQETLPVSLQVLDASHNVLLKLPQQLPPRMYRLDVSHNRLRALPSVLPSTLQLLLVSHNQLKTLDHNLLVPLLSLLLLDAAYNSLAGMDAVWLSHQLPLLNLSHNALRRISVLGQGNVSHIDATHNAIESWEVHADRLTLVGNPRASLGLQQNGAKSTVAVVDLGDNLLLDCDPCSAQSAVALQLRHWLVRQQNNASLDGPRVERPKQPLCTDPHEQAGRALLQLDALEDNSHCPGSPRFVAQYVLLVFTVLAFITGIIGFCYCRRYEITYIIHLMKMRRERVAAERRNPASYKYDAFVCYSSADRSWVVGQMLPMLEHPGESADEPALRLCLHERDFPLGSFIAENIMSSMRNSRSTIVILSQSFVDSQWCRWELELASSKVHHLVLLELTRLERARLPRHLRYLMDTRTYVEWPAQARQQPATWKRLRAALASPVTASATDKDGDKMALSDGEHPLSRDDVIA